MKASTKLRQKIMAEYGPLARAIRDAIHSSDLNYSQLEQMTGVTRQSLMAFMDYRQSLRLDMADKLAAFFEFKITYTRYVLHDGQTRAKSLSPLIEQEPT